MADQLFTKILSPQKPPFRFSWLCVIFLLDLSFIALLTAPMLMPESYSWVIHTTSESAAQGLQSAWLARLGFLLFGLAVLWLASSARETWARAAVWMHIGFAVMMLGTAAFSHRPFLPDVPFDAVEDTLHSFTAMLMGFAFSLGVFVRFLQRDKFAVVDRLVDLTALASAVFIPLLMLWQPDMSGLVQRLMFLAAYIWYGLEAWGLRTTSNTAYSG